MFSLMNWNKEKEQIDEDENTIEEIRQLLKKAVLVQVFILMIFLAIIYFLHQWLVFQVFTT